MRVELLRERYEPLEVVGRGGEGEVIRALDRLHDRHVALKVRPVGDEASRTQLLSEARVLLSLSPDPGLPLVREDFFVDGRYVIAMDWIEGTDLAALLAAEGCPGLDPELVLGYLEQAAVALEHLHGHDPSVVHGDVKPANLILTPSGRIVLVDFGLSSTPSDELRRAGTAGYVAPEVAAGARPTAASDVYSLATTAVALLTGAFPSGGTPAWGALDPERIPALERILRRNLATDPARRDASAAVFAARLRRWWGDALPTGAVTLVLADVDALPPPSAEDSVNEVALAHRGHCVPPADAGPVLMAFVSARDGLDTARELAGRLDASVAAVTVEATPRYGTYPEAASFAAAMLAAAGRRRVVLDDPTAVAVDGGLPAETGLAKVPATSPTASSTWALVAPELSIPPRAAACPYRGLMAFGPEDQDLFFGREEIVGSILDQVLGGGFVAVVGASGSGKSSLVRAGVVPAYSRARDARVVVMTPGSAPGTEVERSLSDGVPGLLVVDQLEEVFTLCPDESSRARFLAALLDLHENGSVAIVVALRADFYGRCAHYPRLAAALAEDQHLLGPMRTDELRQAIEGPARMAGLRFETGLVDAMLGDVEGEPGALPLLSHALYESWLRRDGRVLTVAGYRAAGGVRGAIAHTAEEVFRSCTAHDRLLLREVFLRLTELGEGTEDTRRRVPLAELGATDESGAEATTVLERLTDARLLVVDDGSAEIAHEALIREWPRLRGWLSEDRDQLLVRRQLTSAARSWDEAGRDDADLYRGARLAAAAEGVGGHLQSSGVERAFLEASRHVQERQLTSAQRRARRLRALLAIVAVALVAAMVAGSLALHQRGSARRTATVAQSGRLAAQSREIAARHPDVALLLALEAGRLHDSVDSRGALLGALEHGSRIRAWLQGFDSPVNAAAFSPDGTLVAIATGDGTTLRETRTWRPVGPPLQSSQGDWEGVDFSPDGRTLAIAGAKGRVELWDVSTREKLRELQDPAATPAQPMLAVVRFSPDGSVIAAGARETNHVTIWDVGSGRVLGRPVLTHPPGSGSQSISFSPDSKRIAVPGVPGTVVIWDVASGRRVGRPLEVGDAPVEGAIFARDGRTLITTDDAGALSVLDVRSGRLVGSPLSAGGEVLDSLDLSADGRLVAAASFDGSVYVWDTKTGTMYGSPLTADASPVADVVFSPDGRTLVSSHLRSAVVWDLSGRQVLGEPLGGTTDIATDVAFSPDGTKLVAGQLGGDTIVYDAATRREELRVEGDSVVGGVAVHPDGRLAAVATLDGRVRLIDLESGAAAGAALDVANAAVWQVAFSPDGRLLAVAADPNGVEGFEAQARQGEVQLWDVATRRRVGRAIVPGAGSVLSLAWSGDGTLLATGSPGQLDVWDVATRARVGKPMRVAEDAVPVVAFDPSGRLVAAGAAVGPVRVWRVSDRQLAFPPLSGHPGFVTGAAFDPDGTLLATSDVFGGTRLWDPARGLPYGDELKSPRPGSLEPTVDMLFLGLRNAFSPDGKLLAAAGVDGYAMVWNVDPDVWRRRACAIVGRNLTREEWKLYLPAGTTYRPTCSEWAVG